MIRIDGSYGEGGGQILRTAVSLSCVTGESIEIYNIRANRPRPGLAMQHLKGIEAAKEVTGAKVEGLKLASTHIVFRPKSDGVRGGKYRVNIGTAGSISLILQTIILPSFKAAGNVEFEIVGGTDVKWSPPFEYMKNITFKAVRGMGAMVAVDLVSRGYYPKGGGLIKAVVEPSKLKGIEFERLEGKIVNGVGHSSNLPSNIVERMVESTEKILVDNGYGVEIKKELGKNVSTGCGITLWNGFKGGSSLGERGKRAEMVGEEAALNLLRELSTDSCFDEYLGDQIMPFSAVAKGSTEFTTSKISLHLLSNIYVIEKFFGKITTVERLESGGGKIRIDGQDLL